MARQKVTPAQIVNPYRFSVARNAAWTPTAGAENLVPFDTVEYDTNSNWSGASNYRYTAPITGLYHFNGEMSSTSTGGATFITIYKNGAAYRRGDRTGNNTNSSYFGISVNMYLTAGDYVDLRFYVAGGAVETGQAQNWFQGRLVSV